MTSLDSIFNLVFQLFTLFVVVFSGFAIFALLRYGKSQILGFVVTIAYIAIVGGLYFQTMGLINSL